MELLETTYSDAPKVDRESGVISSVKVLGRESSNGRSYSDRALNDAAKLYESVKVNIDHPDRSRPNAERKFIEGFGELRNCRVEESGVFADLHFVKAHPSAPVFTEYAERFPKQFGLSHNADGDEVTRNGKRIVESISHVRSVDVVGRPATNKGLFESQETVVKKTIKEIASGVPDGTFGKTLLLEMEGDAAMMSAPVEVAADADADGQIDAAFKAMVNSVLDNDKLDVKGKLAKIKDILNAQDKLMSKEAPASSGSSSSDSSTPATESAEDKTGFKSIIESLGGEVKTLKEAVGTLTTERDQLKADKSARELLESHKRSVTPERIKMLCALPDESTRKLLVESWPEKTDSKRPASSPPANGNGTSRAVLESVKDGKTFAEAILRKS